ncbi:MAG: hypothetical protein CL916_01490 [Deltaproteobacteria bacterium]|nr:hypothetical protein [Deltaproteobacteria bacterium]
MPNLYASVDYDLNGQISNNRFEVYVGVQKLGEFTKVSGIGYNTNPFLIEEGGRNHSAHYRPFEKPGEFTGVELTWGAVNRSMMEAWVHIVSPGYPFRRSVFISQMGRDGTPKRLIQLHAAWPKEWKSGDMDASGNEIATESLTLVCEFVSVIAFEL